MNKIRVLMIDDNVRMIDDLKKQISTSNEIDIVLEAYNGFDGYEIIKNNLDNFDVILLDLIMPKKDGFYVLEQMRKFGINKKVIVETSLNTSCAIREISEFDVDYFILKPFEFSDLEKKIRQVYVNKGKSNTTSQVLHNLGIPSNIKGYTFLMEAIGLYSNKSINRVPIKNIYLEIALKYNSTEARVERSIRHAIELGYLRGDLELINDMFGYSIDINKNKPTNTQFIATIAEKLYFK